ncbi:hypothetical protein L218DRAFT_841500, partial [Marasmius fiardii PR-910]
ISQYLVDAEADLKAYQDEINGLKTRLIVLETRRDSLKEVIGNYRSLLSPIRRMPSEILTRIFSLCCGTNDITHEKPPVVMVLARVCGYWRKIVLTAPHLWSSMTFRLGTWMNLQDDQESPQKFRRLVTNFMKYSKEELLDL